MTEDSVPSPHPNSAAARGSRPGRPAPGGRFRWREFYCKTCGRTVQSRVTPKGWYSLARSRGEVDIPPVRLGMYCSLSCLEDRMDELEDMEDAHAAEWSTDEEEDQPTDVPGQPVAIVRPAEDK